MKIRQLLLLLQQNKTKEWSDSKLHVLLLLQQLKISYYD